MNVCDVVNILDLNVLKERILHTSVVAWKHHITTSSLERWLNNFTGEALGDIIAEQTIAAWLLMNFTYYTDDEIRELCRIIYRKFIHQKLQEDVYQRSSDDISEKIRRILNRTVFIPLGNPSESGALILYNFRTANKLPKDPFEQPKDWKQKLSEGNIDDIVFVDDVTLSGSQAIDYIQALTLGSVKATLVTFFATPTAVQNIKTKAAFVNPLYVTLLDSRTNLFSNESFVFSSRDCLCLKDLAFRLCNYYGTKIVNNELSVAENYMKQHPLGFADGQHMFGFSYNTPDNTLPIFWCNSPNWYPAFVRYGKIYGSTGGTFQSEQYW